jgi:hypothetical protein
LPPLYPPKDSGDFAVSRVEQIGLPDKRILDLVRKLEPLRARARAEVAAVSPLIQFSNSNALAIAAPPRPQKSSAQAGSWASKYDSCSRPVIQPIQWLLNSSRTTTKLWRIWRSPRPRWRRTSVARG